MRNISKNDGKNNSQWKNEEFKAQNLNNNGNKVMRNKFHNSQINSDCDNITKGAFLKLFKIQIRILIITIHTNKKSVNRII